MSAREEPLIGAPRTRLTAAVNDARACAHDAGAVWYVYRLPQAAGWVAGPYMDTRLTRQGYRCIGYYAPRNPEGFQRFPRPLPDAPHGENDG